MLLKHCMQFVPRYLNLHTEHFLINAETAAEWPKCGNIMHYIRHIEHCHFCGYVQMIDDDMITWLCSFRQLFEAL